MSRESGLGEERKLLDPLPWLKNGIAPLGPEIDDRAFPLPAIPKRKLNQARVEAAKKEWWRSREFPGEGDPRFWAFAVQLREAGMGLSDIEATLRSEYQYARSPKKRRDQIKSIIQNLKKSRRRIA